jgi:membrane-associated phospholipid phosphatase
VPRSLRAATLGACLLLGSPAAVAAQADDRPPVLTGRDAAVAGGFAAAALAAAPLDRALALRLQRPGVQANRTLKSTAVVAETVTQPGLYVLLPALWGAGRLLDDRTTAAAGLRGMEAVGAALTVVGVSKLAFGRARPFVAHDPTSWRFMRGVTGSGYQSFPSGHTAAAFAAASALAAELTAARPSLRWTAGVPLYLGAATAGWSRMFDDRHWATDVAAGAAIGTVSGLAVARWHRTRPGTRLDRAMLGVGIELAGGPRLLLAPMLRRRARRARIRARALTACPARTASSSSRRSAARRGRASPSCRRATTPSSRASRRRT